MDNAEEQEISQIRVVKKKPTDAEIAEALLASGGIVTAAVAWLAKNKHIKAERSTIAKRIQRTPALEEARQEATEMMLDVAEDKLMSLLNSGDRAAIFFFLKCKGKKRGYIERQETELFNTGNQTLKIEGAPKIDFSKMSKDELMKMTREAFGKECEGNGQ